MHGNQFDLQIAAGGTGAFNNCAGIEGSMFPGGRGGERPGEGLNLSISWSSNIRYGKW